MTKVLVVDDEEKICFAFRHFLTARGHQPLIAATADDAISIFQDQKPEIVFLDIRLPGRDGLSVLKELHALSPETKVVIMTAHGTMDTAVEAMHQGAYDYLTKPIDLDNTAALLERMLRPKATTGIVSPSEPEVAGPHATTTIIGRSPAIQDVYKMIGLLTNNDVPVLIEGESGVGKELVARAIHDKGNRCRQPFVAINCGAMPEALLESELFGHEKGSFTGAEERKIGKFEHAGEGTIFLDEIGDLQFPLQIKLLRVLQERQVERVGGLTPFRVHARVIAATNKSLSREVENERFRSDLYYRLQVITLKIPPLRERKEDIADLATHFVKKANVELVKQIRGIEPAAMDRLRAYHWPGNVRELENVIKRAALLTRGDTIGSHRIEELHPVIPKSQGPLSEETIAATVRHWFTQRNAEGFPHAERLHDTIIGMVEKTLIGEALRISGYNQVNAAKLLGMNRSTLRKKIAVYGLDPH
jgi:two-component system nitrogen regulation response regulator GlnG